MIKIKIILLAIISCNWAYAQQDHLPEDSLMQTSDSSLLHFYRFDGYGFAIGYNIYFDDSLICRSKNKWKTTVALKIHGEYRLTAKTEAKEELIIAIEPGKNYYIRCSVAMGFAVGRPKMELVDEETGKQEYQTLKKIKKKKVQ